MALLNRADDDHHRCRQLPASERESRVVPTPVLVELDHFVPARAFAAFLEDVRRGAFVIADLGPAEHARVRDLLVDHADVDVGFVDAAVPATVERLRESRLATLDHRHIAVMRPVHGAALELVPAS